MHPPAGGARGPSGEAAGYRRSMSPDPYRITSAADLAGRYPAPAARTRTKIRDRLEPGTAGLLSASTFVLLATADEEGRCDVSPRGGPAGFVKVLDDRRVAVPDLNGNHLLDSLRNLIGNPHAALLVVVPGQDETLRIEGAAHVTTDPDVLDLFSGEVRRPATAIVIDIATVYTHCAKAVRRGGVWRPATWQTFERSPFLTARHQQLRGDVLTDESLDEYLATSGCKIEADLDADAPG